MKSPRLYRELKNFSDEYKKGNPYVIIKFGLATAIKNRKRSFKRMITIVYHIQKEGFIKLKCLMILWRIKMIIKKVLHLA